MTFVRTSLCLALCTIACADLPDVPSDSCGNGVIESQETCDTFGIEGATALCRPKTAAHACQLDCTPGADGTRPSCPRGWGCDLDNVCRAPTGEFEPPTTFDVGGVDRLLAGDFDGDLRSDVLSHGPHDELGRAALRFHYFDAHAVLSETRSFPKFVMQPVVQDLNGDARSDVVFSDFRVGVLLGRGDRSVVPETYSSYLVGDAKVRILGVNQGRIDEGPGLVVLGTMGDKAGVFVPDRTTGKLQLRGPIAQHVEALLGDPASGNIIEAADSPCEELVLSFAGQQELLLIDTCTYDKALGQTMWRAEAVQQHVALEPSATLDSEPRLGDVNGDGHLDVMVGAGAKLYVSYGDGKGLATAIPYELALAKPENKLPDVVPLAIGDISGDGVVDFVYRTEVMVSQRVTPAASPVYASAYENSSAPWTVARFADFNGNGTIDLAAGSADGLHITFLGGNRSSFPVASSISTNHPVKHLISADVDGDLLSDIVYVEGAERADERDTLMVAFGAASVPQAGVPVARVSHTEQLGKYSEDGVDMLLLASSESGPGGEHGAITLLDGSTDRIPFAPFELVTFSNDGSLQTSAALGLTVGDFEQRGQGDVLALGTYQLDSYQFWLVSNIVAGSEPPRRLTSEIEAPFEPASITPSRQIRLSVSSVAADFDGDGRDEAAWAMPASSGKQCGLLLTTVARGKEVAAQQRQKLFLAEPCLGPQLGAFDVDEDGHPDLALLTGSDEVKERNLHVLWNDGQGGFSLARSTRINAPNQAPQAFAMLLASTVRAAGLAYVTDKAVLRVDSVSAREFGPAERLTVLEHGTGIVAADLDGDLVVDLAIADAGNLRIMRGKLRTP